MSWVRYDDGFDSHPKVTAVVSEDPGAIALHALANTWSSRQKRPGFVPTHQPGVLVGKGRGRKWAMLLEKHGLWDSVEGGWEFHDHGEYRESGKRSTAGTPAELSEKRRAAGSKGGKAAQQKRANGEQPPQQTEQGATQASADAVSPVVEPPYGASTPAPVPTTSAVARFEQRPAGAQAVVAAYVQGCADVGAPDPDPSLRKRVGKQAAAMLGGGTSIDLLLTAAANAAHGGWNDLAVQIQRDAAAQRPRGSSNMDDHAALIRRLDNGHNQGEIA